MGNRLIKKLVLIFSVLGICAYFAFPLDKRINLGLDLKGGMHLLLKVDTGHLDDEQRRDAADRAVEIIRNRIDEFGVREPSIQRQGEDEIVIQLPGITDRERALDIIGKTAMLEFKLASSDIEQLRKAQEGIIPEGFELKYIEKENREPLLLEKKAVLIGDALVNASVRFNQSEFNEPIIALNFNPKGAIEFSKLTAENVGKRLAIVLDGKVQSAPRIREAIPNGEAIISGRFSVDEAQDLALVLRVGALPAPMHIEEERTIGPLLGEDSINRGIKALIIGGASVCSFMIVYYLLAGIICNLALGLNLIMILGGLGILPVLFPGISATLTLPGIAGIVLSLGMAVDANVLIYERIREEINTGKNLTTAIASGYAKAFSAILDSNITTLIAAFLLFQFGTGSIRGFAVTLTIGLISSLFTSILVTRTIFEILISLKLLRNRLPMLRLFRETKLDFIGKRKIFYALSSVIIISGLVLYFNKGKDTYGIDFAGGQLQEYSFKTAPHVDEIRSVLKEIGLAEGSIQQFKENPKIILIRTSEDKNVTLTDKLKQSFPDQDIQTLRVERVGPVAGKYLKTKALKALIWAMIGILIYVALRFKHVNFAVAGVVALLHDVFIALSFLLFTGRQIDLLIVTAFLTIAGYSINDTIVIYDRVRENTRNLRKLGLRELINLSVNQMLGRTVLTTFATLLVVVAIFFYGGEVLSNFAFTLMVGFISGVYSTIYIASPLVLLLSRKNTK
ncbi:MAG: protein translocase subunit SecD [Candidatus Omnitrophota bacterium]